MQFSTVPTNENEIEIICPNCELTNWLPSGATGDNCENCGHLFKTEYECPHCDGDKLVIDDNHEDGAIPCHYCDGKGLVSYDDAVEYYDHDPNLM